MKSLPDGRKFIRFKIVGTRASNIVMSHICTTASFVLKMRIEKVRGNREEAAASSHRQLCFS